MYFAYNSIDRHSEYIKLFPFPLQIYLNSLVFVCVYVHQCEFARACIIVSYLTMKIYTLNAQVG
jgi:hypothetical protein